MAYPLGFYEAEATKTFHCFEHNRNPEPEMNFNDYIYFYSNTGRLTSKVVNFETLRSIVANIEEKQGLLHKMMMVDESGVIYPTHLPITVDVVALPAVQVTVRQLEVGPVQFEGVTLIIPKLLSSIIDPKPILACARPIYSLRQNNIDCNFGGYMDEILFIQVCSSMTNINFTVFKDQFMEEDPSSRYQSIKLKLEAGERDKNLEFGSSIMLWNGRRITRPSFAPHFEEVITTHKPMLMIITEVGAQATNCERVLKSLKTSMS